LDPAFENSEVEELILYAPVEERLKNLKIKYVRAYASQNIPKEPVQNLLMRIRHHRILTTMLCLYRRCSMILSYTDLFDKKRMHHRIKATVTTNHPASRYGQPVIILEDGARLDSSSWISHRYRVLRASKKEISALLRIGLV